MLLLILLYLLSFLVVAGIGSDLALVTYEAMGIADKRMKKKMRKHLNKKGFDALSEWTEQIVKTQYEDWVKKEGSLIYYFNKHDKKMYISYTETPCGLKKMTVYVKGQHCLEIRLNAYGLLVRNELDDSLDEKMDALKCQSIMGHLDGFFQEAYQEEVAARKQSEQEKEQKEKRELEERTTNLLNFFEKVTIESCTETGNVSGGFRLLFHEDGFGSYATLVYGKQPLCQCRKNGEERAFMLLANSTRQGKVLEENKVYVKEKMMALLTQYEMHTSEIVQKTVLLLDRLEGQKKWLEKEELIWLHEVKKNVHENHVQKQRVQWALLKMFQQYKEMEKMEQEVEDRKLRMLRQQTEVIKLRAD